MAKRTALNPNAGEKLFKRPYLVAIDFDNCLCRNGWPHIERGELIESTYKRMMKQLEKRPETVFILWTCRINDELDDAKGFIHKHNLPIYYFNEHHPSTKSWFTGYGGMKIFANEYWDDRAVFVGEKEEE